MKVVVYFLICLVLRWEKCVEFKETMLAKKIVSSLGWKLLRPQTRIYTTHGLTTDFSFLCNGILCILKSVVYFEFSLCYFCSLSWLLSLLVGYEFKLLASSPLIFIVCV